MKPQQLSGHSSFDVYGRRYLFYEGFAVVHVYEVVIGRVTAFYYAQGFINHHQLMVAGGH